jgi:hypothetical protein
MPTTANRTQVPEPPKIPVGASLLGISAENGTDSTSSRQAERLIIPPHLRNRHLYLIGKTRTGKTTLIKNLALQDMAAGLGVCFVDPHGDAALDLIGSIPKERMKDVIYFDPTFPYCPSLNVLRLPYRPDKLTNDIVSVFKLLFGTSWGDRLEEILSRCIFTLVVDPEPHALADIERLLTNNSFRRDITSRITDERTRWFWEERYPSLPKDAASPILTRLSKFLLPTSPMEKLFTARENDIDFFRIMNEQKILIVNLSKGKLGGDEPARVLGALFVSAVNQSAMARAELPPEQRKEFVMYLDEFQNFAVDSMADILSESAKYRLYLSLAHQTLGQVSASLRACIFGNVASMVAFGISADDAATMRKEMHRTRYTFRTPNTDSVQTWDDLTTEKKQKCQQELDQYQQQLVEIGLKCEAARHVCAKHGQPYAMSLASWLSQIRRDEPRIRSSIEYQQAELQRLASLSPGSPERLRELFPDYDIRYTTFPDVDDFINLQPHHAFARIERAENVTVFRTLPAPEPVAGTRGQILHTMREAHAARLKQRMEKRPPTPPLSFEDLLHDELAQEAKLFPLEEILPDELLHVLKRPQQNGLDGSTRSPQDTQVPPPEKKEPAKSPTSSHDNPVSFTEPPKRKPREPKPPKEKISF